MLVIMVASSISLVNFSSASTNVVPTSPAQYLATPINDGQTIALNVGSVTTSNPAIDYGQSITLTANPSGGTPPYHYQWYGETSPTCITAFIDEISPGGTAQSYTTLTNMPVGTYYFCYTVSDSAGHGGISPIETVTVSRVAPTTTTTVPPISLSLSCVPTTINIGSTATCTASASGGGSYSYTWVVSSGLRVTGPPTSCTSDDFCQITPQASGSYTVSVYATSGNTKFATASASLKVNSVPTVTLSASPTVIDSGQNVTFTAHPSSGSGSYSTYTWAIPSSGLTPISGCASSSNTCTLASPNQRSSAMTLQVSVTVTDSTGLKSIAATASVTVEPKLIVTITPSTTIHMDAGQALTFNASVNGAGTPPYSYSWILSNINNCIEMVPQAGVQPTYAFTPPQSASPYGCKLTAQVEDAAGSYAKASTSIYVSSALSAPSLSASKYISQRGSLVTLSASWKGGTSTYTVKWYNTGSCTGSPLHTDTGVTGTSDSYAVYPSALQTSYCISVTDSAHSTVTVNSNPVTIYTISQYPIPISSESCVYYGGYIYCIGGETYSGTTVKAVYAAQVSNGAVGPWQHISDYPINISSTSCVVVPNSGTTYIYCVGGYGSSQNAVNNVYAASITSPGSSLSSWTQNWATSYPSALAGISCNAYNLYIYCVGGSTGHGESKGVYVFDTISIPYKWVSTNNFDFAVGWTSCVLTGTINPQPYLVCIGGQQTGTSAGVTEAYAGNGPQGGAWTHYSSYPEHTAGTSCILSQHLDSSGVRISPTCIGTGANGAATDSAVYTCSNVGGCTSASNWQNSYWSKDTYSYPTPLAYSSCVVDASNYVYCIGGIIDKNYDSTNVVHSSSNAGFVQWN